jgi:hypothetical protein
MNKHTYELYKEQRKHGATIQQAAAHARSSFFMRYYIRRNTPVTIVLPRDLTHEEAGRLSQAIGTLKF